ncbi:hypothetical protein BDV06DRAFT_230215 [Aspergillus oleicola]
MALTPLDIGVCRFFEFSFTLLYPRVFSANELQAASQALLRHYPDLGSRLNLWRTDIMPPRAGQIPDIFASRNVGIQLREIIYASSPSLADVNVKQLDSLFAFSKIFQDPLSAQVFRIQTLFLVDATVVRFVFQHPFCDPCGAFCIARSYFGTLDGRNPLPTVFVKFPLRLRDNIIRDAAAETNVSEGPTLVDKTRRLFTRSWWDLLKKGSTVAKRDTLRPSLTRVDNTLHIPAAQVQQWMADSRRKNINVTEPDLLAAFIYLCAYNNLSVQDFTLTLGSRLEVESQTPIRNDMFLVPIDLERTHHRTDLFLATVPEIAGEVRRTVLQARRPSCMAELTAFYNDPSETPIVPRWIGRDDPQVTVSSWTDLPLFELETKHTHPSFVYADSDVWSWLKWIGLRMDDVIITWAAYVNGHKDGYWIRGRLTEAIWDRMAKTLDPQNTQ